MKMIVAVDNRWGIGNKGELLVNIPRDKKHFRSLTLGGVVVGGRKTMEGLPAGNLLEGRTNMILTHRTEYTHSHALVVHSVEEAREKLEKYPRDSIFIIGGEQIYRAFLPYCDRVYVTKIGDTYEADTFFPNLDEDSQWEMTWISKKQTYHHLEYYFTIYERVS